MRRKYQDRGLNIIPFIDIILVLLAIVLSISTFIAQGVIPVDVPKSSSQIAPKDEQKLVITITKNNEIYADDMPKSLDDIKAQIDALDPKTLVELKSDKDSRFEMFINILDLLKNKNHENFAIITKK
ncbi:MAG: TonB system transport protein ExbD [Helicobacter sp.]|nr:TonB system transport protein ExbD [Helicobacter sp.]